MIAGQDDETGLVSDDYSIIDLDPNNLPDQQILQIDLSNFEEPKRCPLLLNALDEEATSYLGSQNPHLGHRLHQKRANKPQFNQKYQLVAQDNWASPVQ